MGGSNVLSESHLRIAAAFLQPHCSSCAGHPLKQKCSQKVGKMPQFSQKGNRSRGQLWALAYYCPCSWHSPWSGFGRDSSNIPNSGQGQPRGQYGSRATKSRSLNVNLTLSFRDLTCFAFNWPQDQKTHNPICLLVQALLVLLQRKGSFLCALSTLIHDCLVP